jgi:hypothetical protein
MKVRNTPTAGGLTRRHRRPGIGFGAPRGTIGGVQDAVMRVAGGDASRHHVASSAVDFCNATGGTALHEAPVS